MPVIAIMDGQRFAVHSDHLNTPRRLTDASNRPRWQWAYSAFGDVPAQSLPAAGLPTVSYSLRYPGQVDDFNGLFYNFNRFYDPRVGRYTQADPIGLEGGWNRFGYGEANPLSFTDPEGLAATTVPIPIIRPIPIPIPAPSGGTLVNPVTIPNTGVENACPPNPGNQDPCKGLRRDLEEHRKKLQQYLNDLMPMDNQGSLKNAFNSGNMDRFWIIRATRIKSIMYQIKLKEAQLRKCEEMYGMS